MSILVKLQKTIIVNIFEICQFGTNFANNLILFKNFPKSWFWLIFFFNIDFGENCRKMSNLSKILIFGQICQKFLILLKILKIFDFVEKWQNYRIWSKFWKISDFVKIVGNSRFSSKLTKMSIFLENATNVDYSKKISKYVNLGQNF